MYFLLDIVRPLQLYYFPDGKDLMVDIDKTSLQLFVSDRYLIDADPRPFDIWTTILYDKDGTRTLAMARNSVCSARERSYKHP